MATVITSLVTTVPVVGKQIVYWLWGGFNEYEASNSGNAVMNTLLNAGTGLFIPSTGISIVFFLRYYTLCTLFKLYRGYE